MKYYLSIAITLLTSMAGFGQIMQASIGPGSTATRIKVYVQPTSAVNGVLSTFQFDIAVPSTVTPIPSVAVVGTPAFGITWNIDPSIICQLRAMQVSYQLQK